MAKPNIIETDVVHGLKMFYANSNVNSYNSPTSLHERLTCLLPMTQMRLQQIKDCEMRRRQTVAPIELNGMGSTKKHHYELKHRF